jgi:PhzF family phenazine biosynthesis protein
VQTIKIAQVDAFTNKPFTGCFAGVVLDADRLSVEQMQAIASEMNVDATVFVMQAATVGADYRARIFTPRSELPFAGHPSIAAISELVKDQSRFPAGPPAKLVQECDAGLIPFEIQQLDTGPLFVMTQKTPQFGVTVSAELASRMLGCAQSDLAATPAQWVSTGLPWLIIHVQELSVMQTLVPDQRLIEVGCREIGATGVTVFSLGAENKDPRFRLHVRTFIPAEGIPEDVVCGSGNGCVAAYISEHGIMDPPGFAYMAEQGLELGRPGEVWVSLDLDDTGRRRVRVGGQAVRVLTGEIKLYEQA